ncbi:LOB domain-containing protein 27-like [Mangifera indica]|uniref:LOB domain-containing protein 27-like n=1 Tax=Mangifera indica TaxID=29780 RepID=UPI001CFA527A|nr:LOB domain-containing protein 27-like [Mangifera indica]
MTLKGGTSQACAACKYQRRKCHAECPLAPYFPPDQPKMFANAHKLFGVRNILNILKNLDSDQKTEAMRSIIYQADIRDRYPVHGCWGIICQLRYRIWQAEEELHAVHAQLEMYRHHYQQQQQVTSMTDDVPSQLELGIGMAPPNNNSLSLFNHTPQQHQHQPSYNNAPAAALPYTNNSNSGTYMDSKDNVAHSMWIQHQYATATNNINSNSSIPIQPHQFVASQSLALQQQQEVVHDYDEIHPFFDTIDDRQSYIDSKEAYDSSSEESLKDTTQSTEHVAENELKSAAACFSLTSVN